MAPTRSKLAKKTKSRASGDETLARQKSYPKPPLPKQHQQSPGLESEVRPQPNYQAPNYHAAGKLEGKVALITGGDSGIGRAVAYLYAREGADVALIFLPEEESDARDTAQAIESEGRRAVLLPGDVTSSEFCQAAVEETVSPLGKLDVLVNSAAFQKNQGSIDGAIHAFTKSLAQNLVDKKINTAAKPAEEGQKFGEDTPMGRPGQPEELAPLYVFLASNADSGFMSGEVISVLGGDVTAA